MIPYPDRDEIEQFLKCVQTCTVGLERLDESFLNRLPYAISQHICEIEDLLWRLSRDAGELLSRLHLGDRQ